MSDIFFILDVNGLRRARRDRPACPIDLAGRRMHVQQDDDSVLIPLAEHLGCIHDTVPRGCANTLVDSYFHPATLHSCGVTGASHRPTITSIRPDPVARQDRIGAPAASARSRSAQVCINRLRAMMLRS